MNKNLVENKGNSKFLVVVIIILSVLLFCTAGYVIYDKLFTEEENIKDETETDIEEQDSKDSATKEGTVYYDLVYLTESDGEYFLKDIDEKYINTYVGDDEDNGEYPNRLILQPKNNQNDYEFELRINLKAGISTVKGLYAIEDDKVVLIMQPYQYNGFSGDWMWRREFKINDDGTLTYVDTYDEDIILDGEVFK